MSSQYGEHEFILDHFAGRTGRFLDIGAFDGITFSNTRPLADLGWSGVCVEPSPPAFCHLMRNYEGNPRVELVCAAVWPVYDASSLRYMHCNTADAWSADMMSTFQEAHRNKWAGHPFRGIWVAGMCWDDLLSRIDKGVAGTFQFVNIDVEGVNGRVLDTMPILPEMVCVEWDQDADGNAPMRTLETFGYKNLKVIGGNILAWL